MIDCNKIKEIAQAQLADTDLFVVSCTCSPANEIELLVDSDTSVSIDARVEPYYREIADRIVDKVVK